MKLDSEYSNLPIVNRLTGGIVGTLRSVVCVPGKKKIDGIVYEEKGLLRRCRFLPWDAVTVLGEKSVVIDCSKASRVSKSVSCSERDSKVYSSAGSFLGHVSNYVIDEKNGSLLGLEISASFLDDLKFGRKIIENTGNITKGEDFLLLADETKTGGTELNERRSEK